MRIKPGNFKNRAATAPADLYQTVVIPSPELTVAVCKSTLWSVNEVQTSEFGADERIEKRETDNAISAFTPVPTPPPPRSY